MPVPFQFTNPWLVLLLLPLCAFFVWQHRITVTDLTVGRRRAALTLRLLIVTALVFVLAGFHLDRRGESLAVVFVVDGSRSIREDQRPRIEKYIREASKGMRQVDKIGVITFAKDGHTTSPIGQPLDAAHIKETGETTATNIEQALRQADNELQSQAKDAGKRIVLLSDGNENDGRALQETAELAAHQIKLDTITLPISLQKEALIDRMVVPTRVKIGEPFPVRVIVTSLTPQSATLSLTRDGKAIGVSRKVELHKGKNVVVFDQNIDKPGFFKYNATLDAPDDTIAENNRGESFVLVRGKPTVLYVADDPGLTGFLRKTLKSENINVEYVPPSAMPSEPAALQRFDSIFVSNVNADFFTEAQMKAVQVACRDFGIGFGMVGGDNSYGAGGYRGTPFEETLPVTMDIKKQKRMPAVAVALVIEDLEIQNTVNMSIEAAKATIGLLEPIDQVGVLDCNGIGSWNHFGSTSNNTPGGTWRVKMQHVTDPESLKTQVQTLTNMGDPPSYAPYLLEAARVLNNTDAKIKHIVFLGDGDATYEANQKALAGNLKSITDMGITVSTITTGSDGPQAVKFMAALAYAGKGQAYVAERPQDLPRLLLKDAQTISQPPIIEEPFRPVPNPSDEVLTGIDWASAPPLQGYDIANLKPTANLSLINANANRNDPIFAAWRYGLGRSVAFMSDDRAKWAAQWLSWPGYAKFWAQAVRWTLRPFAPSDYTTQVVMEGSRGRVIVDALDEQGRYINKLPLRALVNTPSNGSPKAPPPADIAIRQTGPGHYEGTFDAPQIGTYLVNVLQKSGDSKTPDKSSVIGLSTAYSPEYKDTQANQYLMTQLAQTGGGRVEPTAAGVFGGERPSVTTATDMTWPLLFCAMLLLPFDIAVRRLAIDGNDLRRALAWLAGRAPKPQNQRAATPELSRLLDIKEGAVAGRLKNGGAETGNGGNGVHPAETETPAPVPAAVGAAQTAEPIQNLKSKIQNPAVPGRTLRPDGLDDAPPVAASVAEAPPVSPTDEEEAGMSRLMAAKRRAQQRQEKE